MAFLLPLDPRDWRSPESSVPADLAQPPLDARGACWAQQVLPRLDLRGANLCRADLRGTDLTNCLLDGCKLTLARYDANTRVPAEFDLFKSGAVGPGAVLNGCFLNGTDLRGMDLRDANFVGAYLSGSDLSGAVLDRARFVGADLRFARLQGCRLIAARFVGSQLDQADFRAADLTDAALDGAESIQGADFRLTTGMGMDQRSALLVRGHMELDCWNPCTRETTRASLESLA